MGETREQRLRTCDLTSALVESGEAAEKEIGAAVLRWEATLRQAAELRCRVAAALRVCVCVCERERERERERGTGISGTWAHHL
jgi:hypothetical protein